MRLIDAHHHLWIPDQREPDIGYGWLRDIGAMKPFGDPTPIQRDYEWPEFAAESSACELVGSVFVQTDGALADPVAESLWVQSVFDTTGLPHAIVALADLSAPDLDRLLERHAACASLRGVRQILSRLDKAPERSFAPRHLLRDPAWRDGYALLAERGLSFDLQCYPEQMHEAAEFIARHPATPVIVDHAGSPHDASAAGLALWRDGIATLAALPNVSVKLCGFGMFDARWSVSSITPLLAHLLENLGDGRLLFGSNFPVDSLMAPYDACVERVLEGLHSLDAMLDSDAVLRCNAITRYRMEAATNA